VPKKGEDPETGFRAPFFAPDFPQHPSNQFIWLDFFPSEESRRDA
jgi:hypothetical protein